MKRYNVWGMETAEHEAGDFVKYDDVQALREAATGLMNECKGLLGMRREELKALVGVTNVRCLERRIAQVERESDFHMLFETSKQLQADHSALVALVREVAAQLERWADESQRGGWSTHQVKPQRQLAVKLYERVGRS